MSKYVSNAKNLLVLVVLLVVLVVVSDQ